MTFQMYIDKCISLDKIISVLLVWLFGWLQPCQGMDFAGKQVYARPGSSIEMKCPNRSLISATAWFREKDILQISEGQKLNEYIDKKRFTITGNFKLGEYNLDIRNIKTEDLGIYVCTRALKDITFEFKFNLILIKLPSDLQIYSFGRRTGQITSNYDKDTPKIYGIENETLTLHCNLSSGVPKEDMMWSYKDVTIKKGGAGSLQLTIKLKPSDSGIYVCLANSSVLEAPLVRTIALTVLYKPRVSINKEGSANVIEGNTIVLYCNIDSNPKVVNISWFRRETQGGFQLGTGTKLQLKVITRRDSGTYLCIAVNTIGKGLSETSLTVMYAPDVTIQYQNVTQDRGVRKLQCNPSGYPLLYTFYDWEHSSDYGDHIRFLTGSKNGFLQFPASKYPYQDNGFYTCTVSNGIPHTKGMSRQSGSVYLNVKSLPVFTAGNDPVFFGKLYAPIAIPVNVFSRPKYSELLIQNQNGKQVLADITNVKILEEHTYINDIIYNSKVKVKGYKITMKIANLTPDQIQKYTFTIKNEFGERQYTISVNTEGIIQQNSDDFTTMLVSVVSVISVAVLVGLILSCWLKKKKRIDLNISRQHMEDESPYDEIEVHEMSEVNPDLQVHSSSSNTMNNQVIGYMYSENTDNRSAELSEDGSSSSQSSRHTTDPKDIYSESYQALVCSTSQQMQVSRSYESLERETRLEDSVS